MIPQIFLQSPFYMWHLFIKNSITQVFSTYFLYQYQWVSKLSWSCHGDFAEKSIFGLKMALSSWHDGKWLVNHNTLSTLPYYHEEITDNFAFEDLENTI